MTTMSPTSAQTILRRLGWRIRTTGEYRQVLRHFQAGWNLGRPLTVDGILGPKTSAALSISETRRARRLPTASPHFSFAEFACKCGGAYGTCARIWVTRPLLGSLEGYRARAYPHGMSIVSGCRCVRHNRDVHGAASSQHLYGSAADVAYVTGWTDRAVAALRLFAGIGRSRSTHLVRHVDRRDVSGHDTTGSTVRNPARWDYAS